MKVSSYKSNCSRDFFRTSFDCADSEFSDIRDYSHPRYNFSEEPEQESNFQRKKKSSPRPKMVESAKYSAGQLVYVKKYNPRTGKFQICDGEIVSSVDKGFGAISYTWIALNTGKTYRAWEDDIYPSYSVARAALDADEAVKESKKEELQPTVTYDNLQDIKSIHDNISVVSVSPDAGAIMLKNSKGIEREVCQIVDDVDNAKGDILTTNSRCNEIEKHIDYLEKELIKEKKRRSKLARLGIACLFGG